MVKNIRPGTTLIFSYYLSAEEQRLATSSLQSHYTQSGWIHGTQLCCHAEKDDDRIPSDKTPNKVSSDLGTTERNEA